MQNEAINTPELAEVVDIQFRPGQKVYYFDPAGYVCKAGDRVIIDTARGPEYGYCTAGNHKIKQSEIVAPLRPVLRLANAADEKQAEENRETERRAFDLCAEKVKEYQLDMQLVSAECAFDGSKILFFFTADERVDFRELVKQLAGTFHTRIELRQIGVRDKAKMLGGLGICGRPFCCASFLDDFQPVSIKMAKTQNLSLNPTKISGTCGRLMCCLKYEQDAYEDLIRNSPKLASLVDTPDGRGTVTELDLLHQRVKVQLERTERTGVYANADIAVLRSGKAKKTDLPIPEDYAPISGNKAAKKQETLEEAPLLDPIKFRYRTDPVADEPEQTLPEQPEAPAQQPEHKRTNRRHRHKNHPRQKAAPAAPQADGPAADDSKPAAQKTGADGIKKRRHPPRRRKARSNSAPKGTAE